MDRKTFKKQAGAIGVRVDPAFHDLMTQACPLLKVNIGDAYTDAAVEWLRKQSATNRLVRVLIEQESATHPSLRALFSRLTVSKSKPA